MGHLSPHSGEGGLDSRDLFDLSDDLLVQLCLDNLPPLLLAKLFRAALSSDLGEEMAALLPRPLPEPEQSTGPDGEGAAVPPSVHPSPANPVEAFAITPLRAASMTAAQLRAHAAAAAAAARAADGPPRRALLDLAACFEAMARDRAADRAAAFRERSGIGSVALTPEDLDQAESLKQRVRVLMERALAGESDGFLLDADGAWHPQAAGDCPRPAFGPFGTEMLGYQAVTDAPGFYLDPRALPDERRRLRQTILADVDGRIDHALRVRRQRGDDSSPWPRVWSAEEIVEALSAPVSYRLSRTHRTVTVPAPV